MQNFVISFSSNGTIVGRTTAQAQGHGEAAQIACEKKGYNDAPQFETAETVKPYSGNSYEKFIYVTGQTKVIVQADKN